MKSIYQTKPSSDTIFFSVKGTIDSHDTIIGLLKSNNSNFLDSEENHSKGADFLAIFPGI